MYRLTLQKILFVTFFAKITFVNAGLTIEKDCIIDESVSGLEKTINMLLSGTKNFCYYLTPFGRAWAIAKHLNNIIIESKNYKKTGRIDNSFKKLLQNSGKEVSLIVLDIFWCIALIYGYTVALKYASSLGISLSQSENYLKSKIGMSSPLPKYFQATNKQANSGNSKKETKTASPSGTKDPEIKIVYDQKPIKCKAFSSIVERDLEPGSKYLKECNDAIKAKGGTVYINLHPTKAEKAYHMDPSHYDVCEELNNEVTQCSRIENNQAITTCRFGKDNKSYSCQQFTLDGVPEKSYTLKYGEVYTASGIALTQPTCVIDQPTIIKEYKNLLKTKPIVYGDGTKLFSISKQTCPKFYRMLEEQTRYIPSLKYKMPTFCIEDNPELDAGSYEDNMITLSSGLINKVIEGGDFNTILKTFNHETGHCNQFKVIKPNYALRSFDLTKGFSSMAQQNYYRLFNIEANADLYPSLISNGELDEVRSLFFYGNNGDIKNFPQIDYDSGSFIYDKDYKEKLTPNLDMQMAREDVPQSKNPVFESHPDSLRFRIPIALEAAEKINFVNDAFKKANDDIKLKTLAQEPMLLPIKIEEKINPIVNDTVKNNTLNKNIETKILDQQETSFLNKLKWITGSIFEKKNWQDIYYSTEKKVSSLMEKAWEETLYLKKQYLDELFSEQTKNRLINICAIVIGVGWSFLEAYQR